MTNMEQLLAGLSDKHLRDLISFANKESRRRKKVAAATHVWTSDVGLTRSMETSLSAEGVRTCPTSR